MPTTEVLMTTLAGLGLLFVGIKMVTRNLSAMGGRKLRSGIQMASRTTGVAMAFGAAMGFICQSGRTTAFILASFVHAGMIDVRRALPIVIWSNFGCTLIIFAAIFPIHLFALFLLAASGGAIAFERPKPLMNGASATFGLALMLLGLRMMSSSADLLADEDFMSTLLALFQGSLALAFLTGLVLTCLAQSHLAIMLIVAAMATKGIFGIDETLMLIFGTHAGSAVITYLTGIHFRGQPRQVVLAQVLYNLFGVSLFLLLFTADRILADGRGLMFLFENMSVSAGTFAALAAVVLNTVTPLLLTLLAPVLHGLCARFSPPLRDEALARPQYLRGEVEENAVATLLLAEKEQLRLMQRLPAYCAALRDEDAPADEPTPQAYHEAFGIIAKAIEEAQNALMSREMPADDTEWLLNQQKRQQLINALDDACFELWQVGRSVGGPLRPMRDNIVEALDTLLLYAIDGLAEGDEAELQVLETMTGNHGTAMERVRKKYLSVSETIPPEDRNLVLQMTSLYERAAWTIRRLTGLVTERAGLVA